MIHDKMENLCIYLPEEYRRRIKAYLSEVHPGVTSCRKEIDGDRVYAEIMSCSTRPEEQAEIEVSGEYANIQFTLLGKEGISVFPRERGETSENLFEGNLYLNKEDAFPCMQVDNVPGYFTMTFPHEAYRAGESRDGRCLVVKKGIIKIKWESFSKVHAG